jgi:hypothetical protein
MGFIVSLLGQSTTKTKVYMRNKSVLIGELISIKPDTSITIKINQTILELKASTFNRFVMYEEKDPRIIEHFRLSRKFFYNMQLSSVSNNVYSGFAINQSVFYRMTNKFLVGGGGGLENYVENVDLNTLPIYGVVKYYTSNQKKTPFLMTKYGYGFLLSKNNSFTEGTNGGAHFNVVLGLRLWGDNFVTELFGGIKQQQFNLVQTTSQGKNTTDFRTNRLEIGIGFMF